VIVTSNAVAPSMVTTSVNSWLSPYPVSVSAVVPFSLTFDVLEIRLSVGKLYVITLVVPEVKFPPFAL